MHTEFLYEYFNDTSLIVYFLFVPETSRNWKEEDNIQKR